MEYLPCCSLNFFFHILVIVMVVAFAGMMSGLTLGLISMSLVDLEVLVASGKPTDRLRASKIISVVKRHHLVLCTLLISNATAMEALPIFLNKLVPESGAIIISVNLILLFGEIIPQSICSHYGLAIGVAVTPLVRVLVWVWFPVEQVEAGLEDESISELEEDDPYPHLHSYYTPSVLNQHTSHIHGHHQTTCYINS